MKKYIKRGLWALAVIFVLMNVIAALHAYSFTHFSSSDEEKSTIDGGFWSGVKMVFTGIRNPRPENRTTPMCSLFPVTITDPVHLNGWKVDADSSLGTVLMFHGYGGCKSGMWSQAEEFLRLNYSVILIDFRGCGDSEGNCTTIGYYEAEDVKAVYDYAIDEGDTNIVMYGTSMGAVAILKAMNDYEMNVSGTILECPFATLYQTVCSRFDMMNMPSFPMAGLLTFWGGVENGFWAFDHQPVEYAKSLTCPTLLFYGEKDPKVSRAEIDEIYTNITAPKQLITFPEAGHENYLNKYSDDWKSSVKEFLGQ